MENEWINISTVSSEYDIEVNLDGQYRHRHRLLDSSMENEWISGKPPEVEKSDD